MLTIITAKFLLKGVIKKLAVQPAISATLQLIPRINLVSFTLFDKNIGLSTSDLIKFGIEKLYEKYGNEKLDFHLNHLQGKIYQLIPANDLAGIFFKEYVDEKQLIVDLDRVDKYLDLLYKEDIAEINNLEKKLDNVTQQLVHDLAISFAESNTFNTQEREQQLIDDIIEKNRTLINKSEQKLKRKQNPSSATDQILNDFPETPYSIKSDKEAIQAILKKYTVKKQTSKKQINL